MQNKGLYMFMAIISLLIMSNTVPAHGQIGGVISSTTGTVGSTTSTVTGTVGSTTSTVTGTVGNTTSTVTGTVNDTISPVTGTIGGTLANGTVIPTGIVNTTASTNVTDTTGSFSLGNPLGLPLPFTITTINASSSVAGVQVFGNGTIVTSMNGVAAKFFFDPNTVPQSPSSSSKVVLTVKTNNLSGSQITGLWTELDSPSGSLINNGYSPKSYAVTPQKEYLVKVFDNNKYVFDHWSDGSTNRTRSVILTQDTVLTAYYSGTSPSSNSTLLTVKTVDLSGNQITGLWTELHLPSGAFVEAGYSPKSYVITSGEAYVVDATNWRKYVFDHWGDGSTNPDKPISLTQDTVLTAYYSTGTTTPSAPTNLSATAISSSQIRLSWSAPSTGGSTITGYKVERSEDNGSTWSTIAPNTASPATAYSDTGLSKSTAYTYRVSAINSAGTSQPSNVASATTPSTSGSSSNIVLNQAQSTSGTTSSNQITLPIFDTGTGSDRLLVVGISANANDAASVTFGGVPLTRIAHSFVNNDAEFWYLANPTGTGNIVATMNGPAHAVVGAYSFSGVNQTLPIPTHAVARNTAPSSPSISIATKYQNSWVLDLPSIYGGSTLGSPTCAQEWNVGIANQIAGASSSAVVQVPGAVTCGWTASTADMWDDAAIEISPSQAASSLITKTRDGLLASDPLNNETKTQQELSADQGYWIYGGDAPDRNAPFGFFRDSQGLHIGVQSPSEGSFAGFYASAVVPGTLFHSLLTAPVRSIPNDDVSFQNGMYVQDGSGNVTYVTCVSLTSSSGTMWFLVSTKGNTTQANEFNLLYADNSTNQSLTRDCTIVTNGSNSLELYLDNKLVYTNSTMNLQMAQPLQVYLEPQTSYAGQELFGTYNDYYATLDETIRVTNLPTDAARVDLVDTSGSVVASSPTSNGNAILNVGKYHFPLYADIKVYDSGNALIADSGSIGMFGGDVYTITESQGSLSAPQNLRASGGNSQVVLSWSVPASNGGSKITNYHVYRATSSNTERLLALTGNVTSYTDTDVTNGQAYFYKVTALSSAGESPMSNEASATPTGPATAPSAPASLSATAVSSSQINLSWASPVNNGGSVITGYKIERSLDSGTTWATIVPNTASPATAYSDTGLSKSTAYTYRVSAINSAGTSPPSNVASATTTTGTIVLNNVQSTSGTTSSNQITLPSFDTGTGSDRLLVVGISANANDAASVTFGGVPLTRIAHSFVNNDAEFWYLANPTGTGNIVATMNGPAHAVVGAYSFSGVNQTLPIPTHAVARNTAPSSPSISIATTSLNSWVLDLPSIYGSSTLGLPTCTQQWDANMPGFITGASSSKIAPSPMTITCGWTASTADMWDDAAIEIKPAG